MPAPQWFFLGGCAVFVSASLRLLLQGLSGRRGDVVAGQSKDAPAVLYSLTWAMLPWKKESARLHLPVYVLGVAYHAGTFLSFFWIVTLLIHATLPPFLLPALVVVLETTAFCGLALLARRIASSKLRYFSSPDDYFSNVLVTGLQALSAASLMHRGIASWLFVYTGILLVYVPLGKLRHAIYYALARFYLGLFYGRRGIWSAGSKKSCRV